MGRFVLIGESDRTVGDVLRQGPRESARLSNRTLDILTHVLTSKEPITAKDVETALGIDNDIAGKYTSDG